MTTRFRDPLEHRSKRTSAEDTVLTRGLLVLLAIAGGAAVGNLYWAQPLLDVIAHDLHSSPGAAGWLVTATQLGYALGVLLIVPLGDILEPTSTDSRPCC